MMVVWTMMPWGISPHNQSLKIHMVRHSSIYIICFHIVI